MASKRKEIITFICIWSGVLMLEALVWAFQRIIIQQSESVPFFILLSVWAATAPFFILSLIHTFVLLPIITIRKKTALYLLLTTLAFVLFALYTINYNVPKPPHAPHYIPPEQREEPHTSFPGIAEGEKIPPQIPGKTDRPDPHKGPRPGPVSPAILNLMAALIMLGIDAAIAFHFKGLREKRKMAQLETENLKYRLDYLHYQISPHFLMNTLNNIHALVDIDSERAKYSIVELSRLMRHILDDTTSVTIPMKSEIDFLEHYIALMKLRFNEGARIETDFSEDTEEAEIPPLILATIIENAFKHGFSTSSTSFLRASSKMNGDKLVFNCENSIAPDSTFSDSSHGIGLENVRKRLELIYSNDFIMATGRDGDIYKFLLVIPAHISRENLQG